MPTIESGRSDYLVLSSAIRQQAAITGISRQSSFNSSDEKQVKYIRVKTLCCAIGSR